jgi:hypothetical protein
MTCLATRFIAHGDNCSGGGIETDQEEEEEFEVAMNTYIAACFN